MKSRIAAVLSGVIAVTAVSCQQNKAVPGVQATDVVLNVETGGLVEWACVGGISFEVKWVSTNPCQETTIAGNSTKPAQCHVNKPDGTYAYQIVPLHAEPKPAPRTLYGSGPVQYLTVGHCRGCPSVDVFQAKPTAATTTNRITISYSEGAAVAKPDSPTVNPGDYVIWQPDGANNNWTVTFDPQKNPCTNGNQFVEGKTEICSTDPNIASSTTYPYSLTVDSGGKTYPGKAQIVVTPTK